MRRILFSQKFPSKIELQRAVAFGGADLKGVGIPAGARIKFEAWHEKEVGFLLPKVWIRILRVPSRLRELPVLWALGLMVGATQMVDMVTSNSQLSNI